MICLYIFFISDSKSFSDHNEFFKGKKCKRSRQMFQTINYPLGSKSTPGKWRACAMQIQYFDGLQVQNAFFTSLHKF